jgi:hypothetical protein
MAQSQPYSSAPARFLSGVSTQPRKSFLGAFPMPNPLVANVYVNDFNTYAAADWTVTAVGGGTSALQAVNGGSLLLTTGATSTNNQGNTLLPGSFSITPGYRAWFAINVTMADTTLPNFVLGLTKGGPGTPTDGVYFTKATASQSVSAVIRASSTSSTITGVATLPTAAAITPAVPTFSLGFFYDGSASGTIYFYSSTPLATYVAGALTAPAAFSSPNDLGGAIVAAAGAGSSFSAPNVLTNLPAATTVLAPTFWIQTNTSVAQTMAVDYVMAAAELIRF